MALLLTYDVDAFISLVSLATADADGLRVVARNLSASAWMTRLWTAVATP
jgi:hypothetical protein